jgi:hypothetical protein
VYRVTRTKNIIMYVHAWNNLFPKCALIVCAHHCPAIAVPAQKIKVLEVYIINKALIVYSKGHQLILLDDHIMKMFGAIKIQSE